MIAFTTRSFLLRRRQRAPGSPDTPPPCPSPCGKPPSPTTATGSPPSSTTSATTAISLEKLHPHKPSLPGVTLPHIEATYLAFLDYRTHPHAADIFNHLLKQAKVALVDGPAFGTGYQGFVRLNFATSRAILTEAPPASPVPTSQLTHRRHIDERPKTDHLAVAAHTCGSGCRNVCHSPSPSPASAQSPPHAHPHPDTAPTGRASLFKCAASLPKNCSSPSNPAIGRRPARPSSDGRRRPATRWRDRLKVAAKKRLVQFLHHPHIVL